MTKKKQHPLGNLHSFIKLIVLVTEGLHQAADGSLQDTKVNLSFLLLVQKPIH